MWPGLHNCILLGVYFISLLVNGSSKIVEGRPAIKGEFPYQVSLRMSCKDAQFCVGSIISSLHILTAAHCVFYTGGGLPSPTAISVFVGQIHLSTTKTSIYRNVSRMIKHENFNKTIFANDIAIIEPEKELPLSKLISPIPMREIPIKFERCIVSGWGYQKLGSRIFTENLLGAEVNIIAFSTCQEIYAKANITLVQGVLCAGHKKTGRNVCCEDSGGPLVCDGLLTDVVSRGECCSELGFPAVYTDVVYLPWIIRHISSAQTTTIK